MVAEAVAAALVGLAGLLLVLQPLLRGQRSGSPAPDEPLDPEETPRGAALAALKEIDFDRETGKLSDTDYQFLKAKYTAIALEALRAEQSTDADVVESLIAARARPVADVIVEERPQCRMCGPRPEPDALFCSTCGLRLDCVAPEPPASPAPVLGVIPSPSRGSEPAPSHRARG